MQYQYAGDENYEHYAAGRVIRHHAGMTAFPVRLASEIFSRCLNYRASQTDVRVYDPCGGSGYLLTVLGFLHGDRIQSLLCSDIRVEAAQLAAENLRLLSLDGLHQRAEALQAMVQQYDKDAHRDALDSIAILRDQLPTLTQEVFIADALTRTLAPASVDVLVTDVPYGSVTAWQTDDPDPLSRLLDAQHAVFAEDAILAIITEKSQKIEYPRYQRLSHQTLGKRRISFLTPR